MDEIKEKFGRAPFAAVPSWVEVRAIGPSKTP
jgi:hypothetical protein